MKKKMYLTMVLISISLAGCSFGFVPRLTPEPTLSRFWYKPGMIEESWVRDWIGCGAARNSGVNDLPRLPDETPEAQHDRTWDTLDRCMMSKSYRFTGDCTQEWNKRRPGCGAP